MGRSYDEEYVEFADAALPRLARTAYLVCGDWHRADEVAQQALVKLYVAWPRVSRRAGLMPSARRAVVRLLVDESRRPWRREVSNNLREAAGDGMPMASGATGRDLLRRGQRRARFRRTSGTTAGALALVALVSIPLGWMPLGSGGDDTTVSEGPSVAPVENHGRKSSSASSATTSNATKTGPGPSPTGRTPARPPSWSRRTPSDGRYV